jgi:hypothetical protein
MKAKSVSKDFPVVCIGGSAGGSLKAYFKAQGMARRNYSFSAFPNAALGG